MKNAQKTCWNCPALDFKGNVDFRACGQATVYQEKLKTDTTGGDIMVECRRRPELGLYDPMSITFEDCPQWKKTKYGYILKNMKVMILGLDGYLGWTLALKLGKLGFQVSGVDAYYRRDWVAEKGSHTVVPIGRMTERLRAARDILGIDINFRLFGSASASDSHITTKSAFSYTIKNNWLRFIEPEGTWQVGFIFNTGSINHANLKLAAFDHND